MGSKKVSIKVYEKLKGEEWITLGIVGVDSGQLLVTDPCYLDSELYDYDEMSKRDQANKRFGRQLKYKQGHAGLGVVFSTGLGDDVYEVEALVGEVGRLSKRVKEVRIRFVPR